eukprot:scaffold367_cov254-Pinguiococcus_pyrenoidosus.AAC.11
MEMPRWKSPSLRSCTPQTSARPCGTRMPWDLRLRLQSSLLKSRHARRSIQHRFHASHARPRVQGPTSERGSRAIANIVSVLQDCAKLVRSPAQPTCSTQERVVGKLAIKAQGREEPRVARGEKRNQLGTEGNLPGLLVVSPRVLRATQGPAFLHVLNVAFLDVTLAMQNIFKGRRMVLKVPPDKLVIRKRFLAPRLLGRSLLGLCPAGVNCRKDPSANHHDVAKPRVQRLSRGQPVGQGRTARAKAADGPLTACTRENIESIWPVVNLSEYRERNSSRRASRLGLLRSGSTQSPPDCAPSMEAAMSDGLSRRHSSRERSWVSRAAGPAAWLSEGRGGSPEIAPDRHLSAMIAHCTFAFTGAVMSS